MHKVPKNLRLLILQDGPYWVAQCLEYDIAVASRNLSDLHKEFCRSLADHIILAIEEGKKPLAGIRQAPKRFHDMYKKAKTELPRPVVVQEDLPRAPHFIPAIPPIAMRTPAFAA